MRSFIVALSFMAGLPSSAQKASLIFTNYGNPITLGRDTLFSSKIHEITINPNATFEFMSRPLPISCLTWHHYNGTWKREGDTLLLVEKYEVDENDMRINYKRDLRPSFLISFKTDKGSVLRNKTIKMQYVYNYV